MLKDRILTALMIVIPIVAIIILLPATWLALIFALIVLIAAWEWAELSGLNSTLSKSLYSVLMIALIAVFSHYSQLFTGAVNLDLLQQIMGAACLWWAIAFLWVRSYPASATLWRPVVMRLLMGIIILVPTWVAFLYLRTHDNGVALIFVVIGLIVAADIGAYFSGKAWGKAKLAPAVSPGKSWAGFWGGLVASSSLAITLWLVFGSEQHRLLGVMAIAIATSLASVLGDLVESMVKREQGVKDSGTILPGHGGFMDRLDSITAAAPVFALCLMLAGW
jgi:phosphatidate cytidylyltransferase